MERQDRARNVSKGPILLPLILVAIGVLLLISNFLLLGSFQLIDLWPLILVIIGAQILLRGDLAGSQDFRTFGITRGSIESATLEINAVEIDMTIRPLQSQNTERLIAGQYTHQSRPDLQVTDVHAHLKMDRSKTPWLSLADWEMGLSRDLPWQIVAGTSLGQINADFNGLIIQNALLSTGIGDIFLTAPIESFEPIYIRSLAGKITLKIPQGHHVRVTLEGGRFFSYHIDASRYEEIEPRIYLSRDADEALPLVDILINGTFGDAYLV